MKDAIRAGTMFDPDVQALLQPDQRRLLRSTEEDLLTTMAGEEPSVLVSLSFHALHYLDLRVLLVMRNLHAAGVKVTLLLRDHQAAAHPDQRLPPQEGRARMLDVIDLLGVPLETIRVVNWSDVGSRLMNDPDFHRFLSQVEVPAIGQALESDDVHFTDFGDVLTTLSDVYVAGKKNFLPSTWLLGGPSRIEVQRRACEAFARTHHERAPRSIPLPPMPFIAQLPGVVPDSAPRAAVSEEISRLSKDQLLLLHAGFFRLLENALGEPLHSLARARDVHALKPLELRTVTADALIESLNKLQAQSRKRRPADVLTVPPARTLDCLAALGDTRRAAILEALLRTEPGLEVAELMELLNLPREQLSSVRRDLLRLKEVGLVATRGIKPQRWAAVARRLEIQLPRP